MVPNNNTYNNGTVYVPDGPEYKAYSLVNPGWEYVIQLDGAGGTGDSVKADLSGLLPGREYEAVSYKTDPTQPETVNLSVTYDGANSTINGVPGFSQSMVIYIRAVDRRPPVIQKTASKATVGHGEIFTYTLKVVNPCYCTYSGRLTDLLDPNLEYVSNDSGATYDYPTSTLTLQNVVLAPLAERNININVRAK